MVVEVKIEIAKSDQIGKGSNNNCKMKNKYNNNVVDILDLAVPQSKVRPIDRLLDRYDWSSASMTPLLRDADLLQPIQYGQPPCCRPADRPARTPPRRPPPPSQQPPTPPTPPTRPPRRRVVLDYSASERPVRKSLWKRAREFVSSCFVSAAAAGPRVVSFCKSPLI
ncbi:acrosin-like [Rhopalosiphum padi]|uniref:acrosin-like n=1 Tax=Rhopalosiphum padi TaxID=40932 RepID=UPI00298E3369|nr:acrosin-like [Rhopalosiphum padi]